jgi:rod shape-determining protein MreD
MRHLISAVVVAVAVVLQLAAADRITFPGGTGPDLVLLTVAALALATGSMAGSLIGFCSGLALDVAPPAGHLVGQDALVFCLVGYVCGFAAAGPAAEGLPEQEHSAFFELAVTAAGAACGEAMIAVLGVMLSDPRVSWSSIKHVLPVAVGYDVLLSPFVLLTVAAMLGMAAPRAAALGMAAAGAGIRRPAWAGSPAATGAVRQMPGGASPRLRLSGQGKGEGWLAGVGGSGSRSGQGRLSGGRPGGGFSGGSRHDPRLRLGRAGSGRAGSGGSSRPGSRPGGQPIAAKGGAAKLRFGTRRSEGVLGGSLLGSSAFGSSFPGRSLLGGSVFSRSSSAFSRGTPLSGTSLSNGAGRGQARLNLGRGGRSAGRGTGRPGSARMHSGSASHAPSFRSTSALSRLVSSLRRPGQRKSPGKGWLRGTGTARTGLARNRRTRNGLTRNGMSLNGLSRKSLSRNSLSRNSLSGSSLSRTGSSRNGLAGRSPGRGWLRKSGGLNLRSTGLGGRKRAVRLRIGSGSSGPARLRMGRVKPAKRKSWRRRPGGYR